MSGFVSVPPVKMSERLHRPGLVPRLASFLRALRGDRNGQLIGEHADPPDETHGTIRLPSGCPQNASSHSLPQGIAPKCQSASSVHRDRPSNQKRTISPGANYASTVPVIHP